MVSVQVRAQLDGRRSLIDAGPSPTGRCFAYVQAGLARLLDDSLHEIGSREVPDGRLLAANKLQRLVIRSDDSLLFVGEELRMISDLRADAACVIGDLALIGAPTDRGHELLLVDPGSGEILDRVEVDADDAGAFIHPHPYGAGVVVELAMGQDGTLACGVEIVERTLSVREILQGLDPVIAGFNPTGGRLLVLPHPSDSEQACVVDWPSLDVAGKLTAADVQTEIGFGLPGCWIDDQRVALYAIDDSLIVASDTLTEPTRVALPVDVENDGEKHGEVESLLHLRNGRVAVGLRTPAGRSTMVVDFAASGRA